jgi:hypothetical protein
MVRVKPNSLARFLATPSASEERQIFPRQMKIIDFMGFPIIFLHYYTRSLISKKNAKPIHKLYFHIIYISYMKRINMQTISISDIQRNLHKLDDFNIVEIVDKKRNKIKGYFLDSSYQPLIEKLIGKKEQQKNNLLNIVGIVNSGEEESRDSLRDERLSRYE